MENKGSGFASKKKSEDQPKGNLYNTPKSLVWVIKDFIIKEFTDDVLDPCDGLGSLSSALKEILGDSRVITNDPYSNSSSYKIDYLDKKDHLLSNWDNIIMNPPFNNWDDFILRAKEDCSKVLAIGRLNYFGCVGRSQGDIWKNLRSVYIFNRYVDYQTKYRDDGKFHVGSQATAWFYYDMSYPGLPTINILDVQKYATLGQYKKVCKTCKGSEWFKLSDGLTTRCTMCLGGYTYGHSDYVDIEEFKIKK